ncbi:hypothetical protein DND132_1139 [Pseudodesulfovibrio mercurii]|uniref:DUF2269 family protein n=1 Tax=Pseudodesulfovibrio mercurii TaxID=641491 RepID=F0JBV9_9BACT|nr:hypothetical protein [Pseudodesulfovibrio mercurii]EGB14352.1 hypothetical protein DND132_1139 [Pseudodesulfovibrio mercurii]
MMKLGTTGQKWLKGLHICAAACWVGGGVALILLYFLKPGVTDGGVLYGMNQAIHHVDTFVVVIPGAFGCLLTGLAYSLFTGFGFLKHGWVILKWVVTVSAIVFGTVCLGPWERAMMDISGALGIGALGDAAYLYNERMNFIWGLVQVAILLATVFISVFKPWKNIGKKGA